MRQRGWRVAVVDLDEVAAKSLAAEIGGFPYGLDMQDLDAVERLAARIELEHGTPYALVAAAAAFQQRFSPQDFPMDVWRKVMQVNVEGTFNTNRVFGMQMVRAKRGSIVNIASTTGHASAPMYAYGPSKAAIMSLTRNLAVEWGPFGVRVNSVSPGSVLVDRVKNYPASRYAKDMLSHVPLGRRMDPMEVAEGVEFLASDRASGMTGTDILIDAGLIAAGGWGLYGGVPRAETESA
jgi:NAD(P)-dependent dehydrogenase (short-subunit alcohol dehydrogenase family)